MATTGQRKTARYIGPMRPKDDLLRSLSPIGLTPERAREMCICPLCGTPISGFRDPLSAKEYAISGCCQACQDRIFGVDE